MAAVKHTIEITKVGSILQYKHTASDGGNQGTRPGRAAGGAPFKTKSKDKVQWKCALGNYAVMFGAESPFVNGKVVLCANKFQVTGFETVKETGSATPTNFYYAVAILDGTTFLTEDPELEITDDGGGSGRGKKAKKKASKKSPGKKKR